MKIRKNTAIWLLSLASGVLMSIPWLVNGAGWFALVGLVPLLVADHIATGVKYKYFWWCHYSSFVLWNALTTFWVCNATVGGGIFAVLANALQMSVVWALFRLAKKHLSGVVPYVLLAAAWLAWERWYLTSAQISWPWLVFGNAFATNIKAIQWYSVTGTLGGSLWVWCCNLVLFGWLLTLARGSYKEWTPAARVTAPVSTALLLLAPPAASAIMYYNYEERSEKQVSVLIGQPNLDPYHKFESMSQSEQNSLLLSLLEKDLSENGPADLLLAPETFSSDVWLNNVQASATWQRFATFLAAHPGSDFLWGASTNEYFATHSAPDLLSYPYGEGWRKPRNSAVMQGTDGRTELFHKSKLVVGTELTPYPGFFVPLDNWISSIIGVPWLMARDSGQKEITLLHLSDGTPLGSAICYESVYGEYCTGYASRGAGFLAVITNDSWWGNTPGYRQHCSYSSLRAIELRRDIARCGNSGISCFVNQRGDVVSRTPWWEEATLRGTVNVNTRQSFFTRHGDVVGRISTLIFLLLLALLVVSFFRPKR